MRRPFVLLRSFSQNPIPDVLTLARNVHTGDIYVNHAKYPEPPVTQVVLGNQINDLQAYYDAARNRDAIAVASQDLAEKILLQSLNRLARYAAPIAYNDQPAIEATGFEASSDESQPAQQPLQLQFMPEALPGGGIRVNLKVKGNADSFTVIIVQESLNVTVNGGGDCITISGPCYMRSDTHPKMTITSLPRKTALVVYAFASNAAGNGPLSAGMSVVTQ